MYKSENFTAKKHKITTGTRVNFTQKNLLGVATTPHFLLLCPQQTLPQRRGGIKTTFSYESTLRVKKITYNAC